MNSKETERPRSRRAKSGVGKRTAGGRTKAAVKAKDRASAKASPKSKREPTIAKRRRRSAVATPYQSLICELLRLKEEFLKRNAGYRSEVNALCDELPKPEGGGKNWTSAHWKRLREFALRWDTAFLFPEELREHPYASQRTIWDEGFGVVYLSPHESNLVVIGIDVRHDSKEIGKWVRQLVRDVRKHRRELGEAKERWKPMRSAGVSHQRLYGEPLDASSATRFGLHYWLGGFPEVGEEALRAWDWKQANVPEDEIRNRLYPDAADLPPDHRMADLVKDEKDSASALKKVRRRIREAEQRIERQGYRQLLPLTGVRSRLEAIRQWEVSSGYAEDVRTPKGGQVRVLKRMGRK